MSPPPPDGPPRIGVLGKIDGQSWIYDSHKGFDLTRADKHTSTSSSSLPMRAVEIDTTTQSIQIDPSKSALVVIDMQNFFLSPALGRSRDSPGLKAQQQLLDHAIPAARAMGMRIIWMNWGLTEDDLIHMPPATIRAFGFETVVRGEQQDVDLQNPTQGQDRNRSSSSTTTTTTTTTTTIETLGKDKRLYVGLGNDIGKVIMDNGSEQDAGRMFMRGTWNTALTPELDAEYRRGLTYEPPDLWIDKNRLSGLWDSSTTTSTDGVRTLEREGLVTLFFAGVDTDQCVWSTWIDAHFRGYDCILLSDASATSSPVFAQQCAEFNTAKFGFCTDCERFSRWRPCTPSSSR